MSELFVGQLNIPQWGVGVAVVFFLLVSLLMMLIVLIQKPQGGGLSGAFGAGGPEGSGQTAFGAKTGDVLTTATIAVFIIFMLTAVGLNYIVTAPGGGTATPTATSGEETIDDLEGEGDGVEFGGVEDGMGEVGEMGEGVGDGGATFDPNADGTGSFAVPIEGDGDGDGVGEPDGAGGGSGG